MDGDPAAELTCWRLGTILRRKSKATGRSVHPEAMLKNPM
jgi:hypothetical protein